VICAQGMGDMCSREVTGCGKSGDMCSEWVICAQGMGDRLGSRNR
jgi:hypothetical protein